MADVEVEVGAPAPDGRGKCCLSGPIEVPELFLWEPLLNKVYHFNEYFRCTQYHCETLPDGRVFRDMVVDDPEKLPQFGVSHTVEYIKPDKDSGVVEFQVLDPETKKPTGEVRYNILHRHPLRIEYSILTPEGVKVPLTNGDVIKQQIKQATDAWKRSTPLA